MPLYSGMRRIPRPHLAPSRRPPPPCRPRHAPERRASSTTPFTELPSDPGPTLPKLPFRFETGIALFAKRTPRPFPRPFTSMPSMSFSDPLSTFDQSRNLRGQFVNGELIRGATNGDDAVFASDYFVGANDGVGAWSTRPRGHAG
ncbi:hypothetical protein IMZ48_17435 [Candidatus Bathyarchaeota archaeon]|nr:hypothetical protein [Candidatus Bathyarchaeota archaeon]